MFGRHSLVQGSALKRFLFLACPSLRLILAQCSVSKLCFYWTGVDRGTGCRLMGEGEGGRLGSGVGFEGVSLLLRLGGVKKNTQVMASFAFTR